MMFLDEAKINIKAGDGGNGLVSFFHQRGGTKKIANGGSGGKGGDVIIQASTNQSTLQMFKKKVHFKAEDGQQGMPNNKKGKDGDDITIFVPVGTIIRSKEGKVEADLSHDGMDIKIAEGGIGGRGNASFVSGRRRFPGFAEFGEKVPERWINLELRLLADIALVGFPNAGKSTIISVISAAKPKIADYPFTTLTPNLGVVEVGYDSFVVADIPGIIKDAHTGTGLGDKFLRHVMRSKVIAFVLDGEIAIRQGPDALVESFNILREELRLYHKSLYEKDHCIILNKTDIMTDKKILDELAGRLKKIDNSRLLAVSAATGEGMQELKKVFFDMLAEAQRPEDREEQKDIGQKEIHKVYDARTTDLSEDLLEIEELDGEYTVKNAKLERLVSMTDTENEEALDYLKFRLKKSRIGDRLKEMGVPIGATVIIDKLVFDLEE